MKVSDYIVKFLEEQGVTDMFGLPGVGVGHFMNSLITLGSPIKSHLVYNEQGASFAACGYAQASHRVGVCYCTAGPGGTNLVTGIANAYCDSIPMVIIHGEKDTYALRNGLKLRQKASQEVDIVGMCKPITKWSYLITSVDEVRYVFEKAFYLAINGRPGPVLIDLPTDIQRGDFNPVEAKSFKTPAEPNYKEECETLIKAINYSQKPLILVGGGVRQAQKEDILLRLSKQYNLPLVTSLVAFDIYISEPNNIGFVGMDGDIAANKSVAECDLLITLGARLNFKQVNNNRETFAKNAKVYRIDCDPSELEYRLRDEICICADINYLLPQLESLKGSITPKDEEWLKYCQTLKTESGRRKSLNPEGDRVMNEILSLLPEGLHITVDTGSHRRWLIAQHQFKKHQHLYQSAGLASMGYALPAAIGVCYATRKPTLCIDGDGGIMMNLQELQFIKRDRLPISVIVFNNHCYGDIMEFQKKVFPGNYYITTEDSGYMAADYGGVAKAFGFRYTKRYYSDKDWNLDFTMDEPQLIEIIVPSNE